ncbi:hypothetical protein [Nocardia sp. XZ_19_385]|uniref:hypothetical protein n=1 Tax=Nocardia sp. XZ_19_385 TaxID=2769488 RepID=UPI00188DEDCD|nr:hypothetical protein [Nocardia sp. XZ_19_385]
MGLLFAGIASALWESSKSGPPDVGKDESPEATMARNRVQELVSGSGLDFQGSKVPESSYKNPEGMDDLYARVQAMEPDTVKRLHDRWEGLRNQLNDGFVNFGLEMTKAIEAKWQGEAANSAATGITDYVKKSSTFVDSVALVSEKVKLVRSAIDLTKPNVQQAPDSTLTSNIASWVPGPTWKLNEHREESYQTAAANIVKNVFYPAVKEADDKVPLVPKPYNPVQQNTDIPGPVVPKSSDGAQPPSSAPSAPKNTEEPKAEEKPETTQPPSSDPSTAPQNSDDPSTKPATTDMPTTPASTVPTVAETPKSTDPKLNTGVPGTSPGSGVPGSGVPGSGVPGSGTPGSGTPGSANPGAGKTISGTPGTAAAAAQGANRAAAARAGTSGMPGMGGMGGARGQGDDDKEHQTKDYLINQENGEILTGLDPEHRVKTVPPVIGE